MSIDVDVLVVGGGLVGGALAAALGQSGLSVAVVDQDDPATWVPPSFDGRASAVAIACQRVLAATGIWRHVEPDVAPIRHIRVTDGPEESLLGLMFVHYDHKEVGEDCFGWIVENRFLRRGNLARLSELAGKVTLLAPARLDRVERSGGGVTATLADGRTIRARLLAACDGRGSTIRRQAGIKITRWDYRQTAIVCTVRHEKPHGDVAHERFLPAGPFAILPLPDADGYHRSSIVWTEKGHLTGPILAQDDVAFMIELKHRFGDFLGEIELEGPRFAYPLSLQFADSYVGERLVLVGDAAHGMHPVAGQGMNYGLRDVAALTEVLVEAKRLGTDVGSAEVLAHYQRWRRFDNLLMLGLTDFLVRLFSNDVGLFRLGRRLGLGIVQKLPDLKKLFMHHAMGDLGELPKLMRGEKV